MSTTPPQEENSDSSATTTVTADRTAAADSMKQWTLRRVLKYARELAYYEKEHPSNGRGDDLFHQMQQVAISLSGLKDSVQEYDKLLDYLEKEESSPDKEENEDVGEESKRYNLYVTGPCDPNLTTAVKSLRELLNCPLKQAIEMVNRCKKGEKVFLKLNLSKGEVDEWVLDCHANNWNTVVEEH